VGIVKVMNLLIGAAILLVLLMLCWPLAALLILLLPILWLLSLPFRLLGMLVRALFALLEAILFLPARLLGWRRHA
jgi:hypothetical protein